MPTNPGRSDVLRKRLRAQYARLNMPCGICSEPIDYSIPYPDPLSAAVDHIIPLSKGGADTAENSQACHRSCNRSKSNKLPIEATAAQPRTYVTWRTW